MSKAIELEDLNRIRKSSLEKYLIELQKLKNNNLDIIYLVIEKYVKKEDVTEVFKNFYEDKELEYIEDSFVLHNKNLKNKYKKYRYIFIDLKMLYKKSFIYFYRY